MDNTFTTSEFKNFIKGAEPVNENGVCSISIDKDGVELLCSLDIEKNLFVLESFGQYREISFGEFETVEYYELTYDQKEVLNQMMLQVVYADAEKSEKEYWEERTEYIRDSVDGYMYAINQ